MLDAALEIVKNSSQSVSLYVVEEIELTTAKVSSIYQINYPWIYNYTVITTVTGCC